MSLIEKAPGTVLPFRSWPQENERLAAYYVALSFDPEIRHAPALIRAMAVDRVIAGFRAAVRGFSPVDDLDQRAHGEALALMDYDRETALRDGWRWGF